MKMKNCLMSLGVIITVLLTGCEEKNEDLSVKGISLDETSVTLKPNQTKQLAYSIFPENATNQEVVWSSSDETVATVSSGEVKALKPGNAIITVTTVENAEKADCSVVVSLNDPLTVSGDVEGIWSKYSVVNVTGHINVPQGKSLTIEEGVEIIISTVGQDANSTKIEFIVNGNLYSSGTEEAPVLFSVSAAERTVENTFKRLWGGIIGSGTCAEILLNHTIVEYTGAITTATSPSVTLGLFKAGGGEGMVAFNTNNPDGKYVIVNSIFRNTGEDAIYVQGGDCLFTNNVFYAVGEAGGEAINVKAGCKVDAAYNLMYSPNTNAFKLSNSGFGGKRYQAQIKAYNNTIVNSGWRRDPNKPKGGSVWAESGCLVSIYNNLIINSMFAVKAPDFGVAGGEGPDQNSVFDYNYYASGTQSSAIPQHIANGTTTAFDGFKPGVTDVVYAGHDIRGEAVGDKNPAFVNFPFNDNPLLSYTFDTGWDFHLQAGSPALNGGYTGFTPHYVSSGIVVNGKEYKSPAPAAYFGAFGTKM
jgi:hypothetical protein